MLEKETITLKEAAQFLGFKNTERLRMKSQKGLIPGAFKVCKCWMFYKPDLVEYIRSQYASRREAAQVGMGGKLWQSLRKKEDASYIQNSRNAESELMNLRKQILESKRKSTKTNAEVK